MKKLILFSVLFIVICTSANSQLYYRKYGVSSLDDLTKSQLEETLKNIKSKQLCLLIVIPSITAFGLAATSGFGDPKGTWTYVGAYILLFEIITSPIWVSAIIVQGVRISKIKKALVSPNLKLGLLTCPVNVYTGTHLNPPAIGLTVTFNF
jgi:hypothetical protein